MMFYQCLFGPLLVSWFAQYFLIDGRWFPSCWLLLIWQIWVKLYHFSPSIYNSYSTYISYNTVGRSIESRFSQAVKFHCLYNVKREMNCTPCPVQSLLYTPHSPKSSVTVLIPISEFYPATIQKSLSTHCVFTVFVGNHISSLSDLG